ncbi:hypothetical protein CB1_001731009 [Camelus ferus]|nr:hypothetical protein CB1_001731009 [Camelus ferus]
MRERGQDSLAGLVLYVGLFGHPGMLHRAKYSRFRNESITSLDEGSPGASAGNKGSPQPPYPALAPHLPAEDATSASQESPTPLCTLIPRMASVKLANPSTLLSLKNFCLGTKEVPRLKLQESQDPAPSSPASPETSLNRTGPAPLPQQDSVGHRATSLTPDAHPLPGPGEPTPGSRQDRHLLQHLLGMGMNYYVRGVSPEEKEEVEEERQGRGKSSGRVRWDVGTAVGGPSGPGKELGLILEAARKRRGQELGSVFCLLRHPLQAPGELGLMSALTM